MEKIKQILKYMIGGAIFSGLFLGGISLISLVVVVIVKWLLSFSLLVIGWVTGIILGLMIYAVGLELFKEFLEWNKERMNNKE